MLEYQSSKRNQQTIFRRHNNDRNQWRNVFKRVHRKSIETLSSTPRWFLRKGDIGDDEMSFIQNYGVQDPVIDDSEETIFTEKEILEDQIEKHLEEEENELKEIRETYSKLEGGIR